MNDTAAVFRPISQPLTFQRLRFRLLRNTLASVQEHTQVRLVTILLCSFVVWVFVFAVSWLGFGFLSTQLPLVGQFVGFLFDVLFLVLAVLLVFSGGLILYSSLFATAEATFLLATPAHDDQVFAYKFQGALAFSSWAFVLCGSPILIAAGLVQGAPWYFYALLPLFFLGYVLVPGSVGAILCLVIVNFIPRRRREVVIAAGVGLTLLASVWGYRLATSARNQSWNRDAVQRLVAQVPFARSRLAPNYWMAEGLQSAAARDPLRAARFLALVWSNGLLLYLAAAWTARKLYRRGYNRVASGGAEGGPSPARGAGREARNGQVPALRVPGPALRAGWWLDAALGGLLFFVDRQTRLLILKDFRTFRRDPSQWAQIVIFSGLLTLYFVGIRYLMVVLSDITWLYQSGVSLLNLCSTALLLCTYTGRFMFPMLSLEGRKFWVLGLLPLPRERLLWGKFVFAATGALLIAEFLVVLSDLMLGVPWLAVGLHAVTVAVLAAGLSGLSVGLGTCMPNFKESDPSKIASGFGGTLNLVAGLLFLLVVIGLMALPWHVHAIASSREEFYTTPPGWLVTGGLLAGLAVGAAAVVVPLRAGARALREMEF